MGTPREAVRLVADSPDAPTSLRMVGLKSGEDWTRRMERWSGGRLRRFGTGNLCGFVLKKDSPSCGLHRVRIYPESAGPRGGAAVRNGRGLFAGALVEALPNLPIEEEGRLHDPGLRDNFVERVFAYQRIRAFFGHQWTRGGLVRFHTAHKLQLLAHSRPHYSRLWALVARAKGPSRQALAQEYESVFMDGLARPATPGCQADVMLHILGHLRAHLDADARQELVGVIEHHRRGLVPLVVPLTLLRHHVRRTGNEYLQDQAYLDPHSRELCLRNHV